MKKLIALLLALIMVLSLVACAPAADDEPAGDPSIEGDTNEDDKNESVGDGNGEAITEDDPAAMPGDDEPAEDPTLNQPASPDEGPTDTPAVEIPTPSVPGDAPAAGETAGQTLLKDFMDRVTANPSATAQELAEGVVTNPIIQFMGGAVPVEPGYLSGFDNVEITGFKEGVMFAPMMGTIPFVGYVFTLEDGADVDAFKQLLSDNANLRWNICTEAEELVVESSGNTVFFLMCKRDLAAE